MPKSTLALKAAVTRRDPAPAVQPDLHARLSELQQQNRATEPAPAAGAQPATKPETPDRKYDPHELQRGFLVANLNLPVTVYLANGIKLIGKLRQFDQFTLLLSSDAGTDLVYKHAVTTIQPSTVTRPPRAPAN